MANWLYLDPKKSSSAGFGFAGSYVCLSHIKSHSWLVKSMSLKTHGFCWFHPQQKMVISRLFVVKFRDKEPPGGFHLVSEIPHGSVQRSGPRLDTLMKPEELAACLQAGRSPVDTQIPTDFPSQDGPLSWGVFLLGMNIWGENDARQKTIWPYGHMTFYTTCRDEWNLHNRNDVSTVLSLGEWYVNLANNEAGLTREREFPSIGESVFGST